MANPYTCECETYIDSLLDHLDENIYNKKGRNTNLYNIIDTYNRELCEAYADLIYTKNDIYLGIQVNNEAVVHGEQNGIDCLANWAVAQLISVGDTPGASDYVENIDFIRHPRGIQWGDIPSYYGSYPYGYGYGYGGGGYAYGYQWGQYYNPYAPTGRKEPATGDTYYVTYKYGCRDENLYANFGALVKFRKYDYQTFPEYRDAIRTLILAYLGRPTIENIKDALSIFHPRDLIIINELFAERWILGENILYSEESWQTEPDVSDGTLLRSQVGGQFEWSITFRESWRLTTDERTTIENIVNDIKPAHTVVYIIYA